jgi:xanthine dehydrogenase accessory factor
MIFEQCLKLQENGLRHVLATIVNTKGSTPGKPGFRMLIQEDGTTSGTVGGGAIEKAVIAQAMTMFTKGSPCLLQPYQLSNTPEMCPKGNSPAGEIQVVPMMCSGELWVFFERFDLGPHLYLFGVGHVGQALVHVLQGGPYQLHLLDNRPQMLAPFLTRPTLKCHAGDYATLVETHAFKPNSCYVVMTHGHQYDQLIVEQLLRRAPAPAYLGVIASKTKARQLKTHLRSQGLSEDQLNGLHSPIGLDLGGTTPFDIALSIAAQLQVTRHVRDQTSASLLPLDPDHQATQGNPSTQPSL